MSKPFTATVGATTVASSKLVVGSELSKGTGKKLEYTVPVGMVGKAVVAMAYVNSPSNDIAQWVKISTANNFQVSNSTHVALTSTFPEVKDKEKLDKDFKEKWDNFAKALKDAGAAVTIASTRRSLGRAYMMHYSSLVAHGKIKPWEVPDQITNGLGTTGHVGVEWSHTKADGRVDEIKSKQAANQMMVGFEIAYPASLTSNHVKGKAIDVSIEWAGTLKIKEKGGKDKDNKETSGKEREIKTTPRHGGKKGEPAGNKELREVADTYGVKKHLTDAPHWSIDGK